MRGKVLNEVGRWSAEYAMKMKRTRREKFLAEMQRIG